ncbi:MAG TPA: condensation domain-containing protein [Rhodocyclaceae bacterium]|nr:condensation domain-containing protein [Rhodocyclaceae bacterium]
MNIATDDPSTINRKLGPAENVHCLLDQLYCLNFAVVAELQGAIEPEKLDRALDTVQAEHPLLRAQIVAIDRSYWFKPIAPSEQPLIVQTASLLHWHEQLEAQLRQPFVRELSPLARFFWFRGKGLKSVVAMVFHPSIADGVSGAELLLAILRYAALGVDAPKLRMARVCAQDLPPKKPALPVVRTLRKLLYWIEKWGDALKFVRQLPGYTMRRENERQIESIPLSLPKNVTQSLLDACREHQTSLQATLGAAQLLALHDEFPQAEARHLALSAVFDLRPALDGALDAGDLGLYSTVFLNVLAIEEEPDFWLSAQTLALKQQRLLGSGYADIVHDPYRQGGHYAADLRAARRLHDWLSIAPPSSMQAVLGPFETPELGGQLHVKSLACLISPLPQHPICITATLCDERLTSYIIYDKYKIGSIQAHHIANAFMSRLKSAAATADAAVDVATEESVDKPTEMH